MGLGRCGGGAAVGETPKRALSALVQWSLKVDFLSTGVAKALGRHGGGRGLNARPRP
jgi:hypothetical protein